MAGTEQGFAGSDRMRQTPQIPAPGSGLKVEPVTRCYFGVMSQKALAGQIVLLVWFPSAYDCEVMIDAIFDAVILVLALYIVICCVIRLASGKMHRHVSNGEDSYLVDS